jgi:hypothetical protein
VLSNSTDDGAVIGIGVDTRATVSACIETLGNISSQNTTLSGGIQTQEEGKLCGI